MGKIEKLPGWNGVAAVVASVFTGVAIVLVAVAFGGDRFDGGFSASHVASSVQKHNDTMFAEIERRQADIDARQDAKLVSIDEKLDVLIARPE